MLSPKLIARWKHSDFLSSFFKTCVNRPVLVIGINLLIVCFGLWGYKNLELRQLPEFKANVLSIVLDHDKNDVKYTRVFVTEPVEIAIADVEGVINVDAISFMNRSVVNVSFSYATDLSEARKELKQKINNINFDSGISWYLHWHVAKQHTMLLGVTEHKDSKTQTAYYVEEVTKRLRQVKGVDNIEEYGIIADKLVIDVNLDSLSRHNVKLSSLLDGLKVSNYNNTRAGNLVGKKRNLPVVMDYALNSKEDYLALKVKNQNKQLVPITDFAEIYFGDPMSFTGTKMLLNGTEAVVLVLSSYSAEVNPIKVSKSVHAEVAKLNKGLTGGMEVSVLIDPSVYIDASIDGVIRTLAEAIILVSVIMIMMLGSWRLAITPMATIPVCLIGVMAILYLFGYTVNTLSLLALVLAIGLVVDDAIVMVENIHRHLKGKIAAKEAAIKGSRELFFAIVAMTITSSTVYIPIAFNKNSIGHASVEFAVALVSMVVLSGFVALTMVPAICGNFLSSEQVTNQLALRVDKVISKLTKGYVLVLNKFLLNSRAILLAIGFVAIFCLLGAYNYFALNKESTPLEDQGMFFISSNLPAGTTSDVVESLSIQLREKLNYLKKNYDYIDNYLLLCDYNSGYLQSYIRLVDWSKRSISSKQIKEHLEEFIPEIKEGTLFVVLPKADLGNLNSSVVSLRLTRMGSVDELYAIGEEFLRGIGNYPKFNKISSSLDGIKDFLELKFDRIRAQKLNINGPDVYEAIKMVANTKYLASIPHLNNYADVILKIDNRNDINNTMQKILVGEDKTWPLAEVVSYTEFSAYTSFSSLNSVPSFNIKIDLMEDAVLQDVIDYLNASKESLLGQEVNLSYDLNTLENLAGSFAMSIGLIFAIITIYLALALLFESFIDPLIIILTVPLSVAGAVITLMLVGGSNNIYSQIGIITLAGLISKHGILIVNFANRELSKGENVLTAIIEACKIRFRPIVMTSLAMILGAIPLVLSTGPGAVSRSHIGWVVISGLLIGSLFSLFFIPAAYYYFKKYRPSWLV